MKPRSYSIKTFIMQSGERYCLLIDKASGLFLYYPNLFVTTQVRNQSLSVAAMEAALVGINVLLTFCDERGIDLETRFLKREFFMVHELDAIRDYCQQSFIREKPGPKGRQKPARKVGLGSEYMRLTHISQYSKWLAEVLLTTSIDRDTAFKITEMKKGLESRRPIKKARNQLGCNKGLNKEQLAVLHEVIRPGSESNPFVGAAIQARNRSLILLLEYLGIRGGELLNIRVRDIDFLNYRIVIARRADEKNDPRTRQPLVKTLDRLLPMKATLIQEIHRYIVKFRSKVPGAKKHDYLFVTHKSGPTQGQPMSGYAYMKVINSIASAAPALSDLRGHRMRHTWNDLFSQQMDQMNNPPSHVEQEAQRSFLQGWKAGSGTAAIYTRRFTEAKAMESSLKLQEGMSRIPENLKND